jgi:hypothetical protein
MYAASGTIAKAAVAEPRWEYFLYGVTSSIAFSDQTYSFVKPVGFIMGLTKNRVNALLVTQTTLSSLNLLSVINLTPAENYINIMTSTSQTLAAYSWSTVTTAPPTIIKNKWIWQTTACVQYSINFSDTCYYYAFFEANKAFVSSKWGTPKLTSSCDQANAFSFTKY